MTDLLLCSLFKYFHKQKNNKNNFEHSILGGGKINYSSIEPSLYPWFRLWEQKHFYVHLQNNSFTGAKIDKRK